MARPISDEELQLKKRARRRLVGAVVLVSAAAVVLPMVLDSEPRSSNSNVDIHIPSPDAAEFKPKATAGVPADSKAAEGTSSQTQSKSQTSSAKPPEPPPFVTAPLVEPPATGAMSKELKEPEPKSAASESPKEKVSAKPTVAKEAKESTREAAAKEAALKEALPKEAVKSTAGGAYVVQVAALSDSAKARTLEKQIAGAGVKTYTEVVSTPSGEVTRVRAGPFASREAAEKARTQLKKAGLDGKVVAK